uniref:Uncharacterized protein n=1 Tax=Ditylenchus dipsaci TaxID=166011 RepID=A0A915E2C3_9BILA
MNQESNRLSVEALNSLSSHAQSPVKAIAPAISAKRLAKQASLSVLWQMEAFSPASLSSLCGPVQAEAQFRDPLLKRL